MQITRLIYTSKHKGLNGPMMQQIMLASRANNVRDLVTGVLIVGEGHLMQLLEGSRKNVSRCFMRIMQDKRHYDIQVISCGDVGQRLFQEWSMHLIKPSQIRKEILSNCDIGEQFDASSLSEFSAEDLCRALSAGNWNRDEELNSEIEVICHRSPVRDFMSGVSARTRSCG